MADVGRPTEYKPEYVQETERMCHAGATDAEIAETFGVSITTLYNWRNKYPEFLKAIKSGKEQADDRIERSLYQKGLAGDTTAMIFWLKNRRSKEWREKSELDVSGLEKLAETIAAARKRT